MCTWLIMEISICLFSLTLWCNNLAANWFQQALARLVMSGIVQTFLSPKIIPSMKSLARKQRGRWLAEKEACEYQVHSTWIHGCLLFWALKSLTVSMGLMTVFSYPHKFKNIQKLLICLKLYFIFLLLFFLFLLSQLVAWSLCSSTSETLFAVQYPSKMFRGIVWHFLPRANEKIGSVCWIWTVRDS